MFGLGVSPSMIRTRVTNERLFREHRCVYAVTRAPVLLGAETAALLAVGAPAALSHESAGRLHEIWSVPPSATDVVVSVPGTRARSRTGIRVHRSVSLAAADVTVRHGLPVTTAGRTLLDLAELYPARAIERALDEALARRLISPTKLRELLTRSPGRRGAPLLAKLVDPNRARGVTREAAEERLLQLIRHAGLPDPERNRQIGVFDVDFLWRHAGVVVEFDSFKWHAGPWSFKRDREKDACLKDLGLDLHRVTWSMLEDPVPLIARLVRAVERAGH